MMRFLSSLLLGSLVICDRSQIGPIEIVVGRFSENLDWLGKAQFIADNYVIYNKNPLSPIKCPENQSCYVEELPNVGREGHSYLHHIITNYESLAEVTVFLPGSITFEFNQLTSKRVTEKARKTLNTVFTRAYKKDILTKFESYQKDGHYEATNAANLAANPDTKLLDCPERPFGAWFRKNFPHIVEPVYGNSQWGIFAVGKQHILQHPKEYYERLIKYLDHHHNPEAGHFFEVAWGAVFYPYPDVQLMQCTRRKELAFGGCDYDPLRLLESSAFPGFTGAACAAFALFAFLLVH